jgi:hypothetical protein
MESGEAPQTGASQAGSVTTVPFEVVRRTEFVFEPFVGSLIQLPELRVQGAQSSEFFLPQSPMVVAETKTSAAAGAGEAVVWEKSRAAAVASEEENALAGVHLEKTAERESEKSEEGLRFFEPKRLQVFDPSTAATQEGRGEEAAASQEEVGRRSSIEFPPQLKAAKWTAERKEVAEPQVTASDSVDVVEARPTAESGSGALAMEEAARVEEAEAELEPAVETAVGADSLMGTAADEEERVAGPKLQPAKPVSENAAVAYGERATWEVELAEALLAQTQVGEEAEPPKKKEKLSLKSRLRRWLEGETVSPKGNRRRAARSILPGLVAFYWSGGTPSPHEIVNISRTGFYLRTHEFWSVETLVRMTLVRPRADKKEERESISVLARVVRIEEGGVGHEFVTTEALIHARSLEVMPSHGTDWRELDRFLDVG